MIYYMRLSLYVAIVGLFWTLSAFIIQNENTSNTKPMVHIKVDPSAARAEIKAEFIHAWTNYQEYAWGSDELCSLTKVRFR